MMAAIHIEMVSIAAPYHAAQIKVDRFPMAKELPRIRALVESLVRAVAGDGLSSDVFLQSESMNNGREAFNAHLSGWQPEVGLGVWPDRPPPELWKMTDLFRMARGERVPLMYQVNRLKAGPKANSEALHLLLGSGMVISIVHPGSEDELLAGYKKTFLPNIKQPNLRIMPFYVPLLDLKSLQNRRADELHSWLGGARLYLRESPSENAVLLVTDADLESILKGAGARENGRDWIVE
ncbi:MAG TPA: hypothetical protein VMB85_07845 [Bryobacteraceae bacterium]|nr:hypothetical protein [Bryobacteraceae bacterium]